MLESLRDADISVRKRALDLLYVMTDETNAEEVVGMRMCNTHICTPYFRTYIRLNIHSFMPAYVHTYIRTYIDRYVRVCIRTCMYTYVYTSNQECRENNIVCPFVYYA